MEIKTEAVKGFEKAELSTFVILSVMECASRAKVRRHMVRRFTLHVRLFERPQ